MNFQFLNAFCALDVNTKDDVQRMDRVQNHFLSYARYCFG